MLFLGLLEAVGCGGVNLCKRVLGMQIGLDGEIGLPRFLLLRFQDDEVFSKGSFLYTPSEPVFYVNLLCCFLLPEPVFLEQRQFLKGH